MRPSKATLLVPACALKESAPAVVVRSQPALWLFLFVCAAHLPRTLRPATRLVKLKLTVAGSFNEKENVVPIGVLPCRLIFASRLPSRHRFAHAPHESRVRRELRRWCDDRRPEAAIGFAREHDDRFFFPRAHRLCEDVVSSVPGEIADEGAATSDSGRCIHRAWREVSVVVPEEHVVLVRVTPTPAAVRRDDDILGSACAREVPGVDRPDFGQGDGLSHGEVAVSVSEEDLDLVRDRAPSGARRCARAMAEALARSDGAVAIADRIERLAARTTLTESLPAPGEN